MYVCDLMLCKGIFLQGKTEFQNEFISKFSRLNKIILSIYLCVISDNYSIILILIITILMVRWPLTVNFLALLKLHATEVDRHGLTVSNEVPRRV